MKEKFEKIPLAFINGVSIISGICTIISTVFTTISFFYNGFSVNKFLLFVIVTSISFNVLLFTRIRKYALLETLRLKVVPQNMHNLLHEVRDVYFEVMSSYKKNVLSQATLTNWYKSELTRILNNLSSTMTTYTSQDICACIKLIPQFNIGEEINLDNATLITFCRSDNSDHRRSSYESSNKPILIKDNSDFFEVVSPLFEKTYFYQGNLKTYAEGKRRNGEQYKNSNPNWDKFYNATVVVPIRIERNKLYHIATNDAYHILGFLCIDSMSTDAFSKSLENYYVNILYAYADIIYILLGQYCHYLRKFDKSTSEN